MITARYQFHQSMPWFDQYEAHNAYKISTLVITSDIETVCCINSMSEISTCDTTSESDIAYYIGNIIICCIHQIISMQRRYRTAQGSTNSSCCSCSGAGAAKPYILGYGNTRYYAENNNYDNKLDKSKTLIIFFFIDIFFTSLC